MKCTSRTTETRRDDASTKMWNSAQLTYALTDEDYGSVAKMFKTKTGHSINPLKDTDHTSVTKLMEAQDLLNCKDSETKVILIEVRFAKTLPPSTTTTMRMNMTMRTPEQKWSELPIGLGFDLVEDSGVVRYVNRKIHQPLVPSVHSTGCLYAKDEIVSFQVNQETHKMMTGKQVFDAWNAFKTEVIDCIRTSNATKYATLTSSASLRLVVRRKTITYDPKIVERIRDLNISAWAEEAANQFNSQLNKMAVTATNTLKDTGFGTAVTEVDTTGALEALATMLRESQYKSTPGMRVQLLKLAASTMEAEMEKAEQRIQLNGSQITAARANNYSFDFNGKLHQITGHQTGAGMADVPIEDSELAKYDVIVKPVDYGPAWKELGDISKRLLQLEDLCRPADVSASPSQAAVSDVAPAHVPVTLDQTAAQAMVDPMGAAQNGALHAAKPNTSASHPSSSPPAPTGPSFMENALSVVGLQPVPATPNP